MPNFIKRFKKVIVVFLVVLVQFVFIPAKNAVAASGASPNLGNAASFAVLAGSAVTNIPTSVITGDVGLSPAAGSNYSGLTANEVLGTIFATDASGPSGAAGNNPTLVNNAKNDLTTAYTNLALGANADANCDPSYQFLAGNKDLSGKSLPPGVYCADTFTLTGTLTLTGSGVWVFRSAATLITSGTANVVGGDPCSIWWQVPSSATLGTDTSLKGNILALTSITMNTRAALTGRALARNGAVTLQSNIINQSCTGTQPPVTFPPTGASFASCPPLATTVVPPSIIDSRRVSPTSIFLSWGPFSGANMFNVEFGTVNGSWLYNTDVTGFSTTINNLPANTPIWVRVAARNSCTIGDYGASRLIGGPGLPNTGLAAKNNNLMLYVSSAALALSLFLLLKLKRV